jgi:zinc transport system permease protein
VFDFLKDIGSYAFLRYALLAGVLSSIATGIIGSYVTVKRISYIAGAIAHTVLAGLGAAKFLQVRLGWSYPTPLQGAMAAGILAALIIGTVTRHGKQRMDTVLSAVWSIGMAVGIFFIFATPGYSEDLMSYLFGNILMIRSIDVMLIAILDGVILLVIILFYNKLFSISFDEEFTRLKGIKTGAYYYLMLVMTSITIVLLVQIVGIVMVIALLTLPAATASILSKRLWQMMALASLLSLCYTTFGLMISYGANLPTGATIIAFSGVMYLVIILLNKVYLSFRKQKLFSHKKIRKNPNTLEGEVDN